MTEIATLGTSGADAGEKTSSIYTPARRAISSSNFSVVS
jgi:hypothetical protein